MAEEKKFFPAIYFLNKILIVAKMVDYRMKLATKAKGVTELAFYQKRKRIMVPLPV